MKKNCEIIFNEYYVFEKPVGYIPTCFLKTEDEIRDKCKKNKILVQEIIKYDAYKVIGKKVRNKKTFDNLYKILQQLKK